MEGMPHMPSQPRNTAKEMLVRVLTETGSVHGSGYEILTDTERTDIDSVLSRSGMSLDDPGLGELPGETLKGLLEYARMPIGAERQAAASSLVDEIGSFRAEQLDAREEYRKAA